MIFSKEEEKILLTSMQLALAELKSRGKQDVVDHVVSIIEEGVNIVENPQAWLVNLLEAYELMYKELTNE